MSGQALAGSGEWFGHPKGLTVLFLTETWTQFSFFGMRALLVLYMTKQLLIGQEKASWIYGGYAAAFYLTPIFGGIIADRWLGRRNAVLTGAIIMALGHFAMAYENLLYAALATIAIGNGLFLPSLPSQIESLYAPEDHRRHSAYVVYYFGVNLGAFAAPFIVGTVGEILGFHFGFTIAGVGMLVALAIYAGGSKHLPPDRRVFALDGGVSVRATQQVRDRLFQRFLFLALIAGAVVVFRAAYEQLGNTVPLWADRFVDRNIAPDRAIPVTWFLALNSLTVFALTPVFIGYWSRLAARGTEPMSVTKMVIGAAIVGLSYLALSCAAEFGGHQAPWSWLAGFVVVMTAGELWILPVGLGLFGRLAPAGHAATSIALWFSAGFLGNLLAAWLGAQWSRLSPTAFFASTGAIACGAAALLLLLRSAGKTEEAGSFEP